MNATDSSQLPHLLDEFRRVAAAMAANFEHSSGGRGKQGLRRTNAALRRGAQYRDQLCKLEAAIRAQGGTPPWADPKPAPVRPAPRPAPAAPVDPDPRSMTTEALRAEDTELDRIRRETGAFVTARHRSVKAELGRRAAEAAKAARYRRGVATRARRKAAGLPPLRQRCTVDTPPPGGWTDADRVN